jgi:hypothetical protein
MFDSCGQWVICGRSACLQDGDNNAMKKVGRLQFKKAWNKNWELRDSKNGFPAFFPKSACYIIKYFWLVGSWRE